MDTPSCSLVDNYSNKETMQDITQQIYRLFLLCLYLVVAVFCVPLSQFVWFIRREFFKETSIAGDKKVVGIDDKSMKDRIDCLNASKTWRPNTTFHRILLRNIDVDINRFPTIESFLNVLPLIYCNWNPHGGVWKYCEKDRCETDGKNGEDPFISCRPLKNKMQWYDGIQSKTFDGKPCSRWDKLPEWTSEKMPKQMKNLKLSAFLSISRVLTLSEVNNYCRNGDGAKFGPWCVVNETSSYTIEPCFHPCKNMIHFSGKGRMCFAKQFLPFIQPEQISRRSIVELVPYSSVRKSLWGKSDEPFKKCFLHGPRASIIGPWTFSSRIPKSFHPSYLGTVSELEMTSYIHGYREKHTAWTQCVHGCEDTGISCWPIPQNGREIPYYGHKNISSDGRSCINYMDVFGEISQKNSSANSSISLIISIGFGEKIHSKKDFLSSSLLKYFDSSYCLNLLFLLNSADYSLSENDRNTYGGGPGCFVRNLDQTSIDWAPCFPKCDCKGTVAEPVYRYSVCRPPKNSEYEEEWAICDEYGTMLIGADDLPTEGGDHLRGRIFTKNPIDIQPNQYQMEPPICGGVFILIAVIVYGVLMVI